MVCSSRHQVIRVKSPQEQSPCMWTSVEIKQGLQLLVRGQHGQLGHVGLGSWERLELGGRGGHEREVSIKKLKQTKKNLSNHWRNTEV